MHKFISPFNLRNTQCKAHIPLEPAFVLGNNAGKKNKKNLKLTSPTRTHYECYPTQPNSTGSHWGPRWVVGVGIGQCYSPKTKVVSHIHNRPIFREVPNSELNGLDGHGECSLKEV